MKCFLKIKRIRIYPNGNMVISLRSCVDVCYDNNKYINIQTGEVMEPIFDEFTEELIGFISEF